MNADAIQIDGTHYKDMPMQPWDVMQAVMTAEEFRGFLKGNIIKYAMRDGKKPGAGADAAKAGHYRQKLDEVTGVKPVPALVCAPWPRLTTKAELEMQLAKAMLADAARHV